MVKALRKGGNMSKLIDLIGQKFGRLTVVERAENGIRKDGSPFTRWMCKCDCGKEKIVTGSNLRKGITKSCGCYAKEQTGKINRTHGLKKSKLYVRWRDMKLRCNNPNDSHYKDYGGRGITVCNEWLHDFKAFYDWSISNGFDENLSLDRIDVNGNYEPLNCRWITMKEQQNNRRNNHWITYNGETHTMMQWSEITGINFHTIKGRLKMGWTIERAFTTPVKKHKKSQ